MIVSIVRSQLTQITVLQARKRLNSRNLLSTRSSDVWVRLGFGLCLRVVSGQHGLSFKWILSLRWRLSERSRDLKQTFQKLAAHKHWMKYFSCLADGAPQETCTAYLAMEDAEVLTLLWKMLEQLTLIWKMLDSSQTNSPASPTSQTVCWVSSWRRSFEFYLSWHWAVECRNIDVTWVEYVTWECHMSWVCHASEVIIDIQRQKKYK